MGSYETRRRWGNDRRRTGTTNDGKGMTTWKGYGIGRFTSPGKISFRGSLFFRAPPGKLSYFNNLIGVFEFEVDEDGNCSSKVWEWK